MSASVGQPAVHLGCVMVHHQTPGLALDALEALAPQLEPGRDAVVIVDDASGDDSADRIEHASAVRGYGRLCRAIRLPRRVGRSAAYNAGIRALDAEYYLLLSSHTLLRERALVELFTQLQRHAGDGIVGPRLESPDGSSQPSCFRDHTPLSELLATAPLPVLQGLLDQFEVTLPVPERALEVDWLSFACALIRREVVDQIGLLDEGYFMEFEDSDYCRAARGSGFRVRYCPRARAVHLGELAQPSASERRPRHWYAARSRYFRKRYGLGGLWRANALWQLGRSLALGCELVGRKPPDSREREWLDNWTDAFRPQR
jgi:GT2 family glycosyltransferase